MGDFNTLKSTAYAWQDEARVLICAGNILLDSYEGSSLVEKLPFEPNEAYLWRPLMVLYDFGRGKPTQSNNNCPW